MEHFTSHDLRRTVANAMCEMGLPLDQVAAVIGHDANGRATRTLVRHYSPGDLIDAKTNALKLWDGRLREIIAGMEPADNVLHFRPTG